jgi:hypothetical protein
MFHYMIESPGILVWILVFACVNELLVLSVVDFGWLFWSSFLSSFLDD